jgi:hypothetical protein
MMFTRGEDPKPIVIDEHSQQEEPAELCFEDSVSLHRWLVTFASGPGWYAVGEYVALDAQAAIDRAVEVFGTASDYRAEEIPWDAAPLPRPIPRAKKYLPQRNAEENR